MGPHSAIEFADKNREMMQIMTLKRDFIKASPFPRVRSTGRASEALLSSVQRLRPEDLLRSDGLLKSGYCEQVGQFGDVSPARVDREYLERGVQTPGCPFHFFYPAVYYQVGTKISSRDNK